MTTQLVTIEVHTGVYRLPVDTHERLTRRAGPATRPMLLTAKGLLRPTAFFTEIINDNA